MTPLIEPSELATILRSNAGSEPAPLLLDVRWVLGGPDGRTEFALGHIPGAVYVDLDAELASHGEATDGRHPLPSIEELRAAAARWGLSEGRSVVVYDDNGGMSAARAWWLLRHAGHAEVRVLNGGLAAWKRAEGPLDADEAAVVSGLDASTGYLSYGTNAVLDADSAAELARDGVLLDARAAERYRGEVEPIDPQAGHIPGAISAPTAANLDADGRMLAAEALRERFSALGVEPGTAVGVYCGSGVTAAHQALALASAGLDAAVYPGSWSQWSNLPGRPIAVGATP